MPPLLALSQSEPLIKQPVCYALLCFASGCMQAIDPNLVKLAEAYSIAAEKLGLLADATGACPRPACPAMPALLPCPLPVGTLRSLPLPRPAIKTDCPPCNGCKRVQARGTARSRRRKTCCGGWG